MAIAALAGVCVALRLADPFGDPAMSAAAAVILFAILMWSSGLVPEPVTALAFFAICAIGAIAPQEVFLAGFAANAFWLVFGGVVLGATIRTSGLADRIAHRAAPALRGGYGRAVAGVCGLSLGLAFVMPATMGRILILLPVIAALADRLGYGEGSRGRLGLLLTAVFATFLPGFGILPANVPPIILAGASDAIYGVAPAYGPYLLLHFPVLGAAKALLIIAIVVVFFSVPADAPKLLAEAPPPWSAREKRVAALLAVTVALWASDTVHGVSPAWVALAAALLCLLPGLGLGPEAGLKQMDLSPLLFVAAIVGLGAMVAETGLGVLLAERALAVLPLDPANTAGGFFTLAGLSTVLAMAATAPGAPAVMTPLAGDLAQAAGWSLEAALMIQIVGVSTILFPYQAPPVVIGAQMAGARPLETLRLCLTIGVASLLLWPLNYLWWRALGVI